MEKSFGITHKNIRATADQEFWTNDYPDSIYLLEGAKHNLTLSEMENLEVPTMKDLFQTEEEIKRGHDFIKDKYFQFMPYLADILNEIHGIEMSVSFWRVTFDFWLYRHLSIVYEKYTYLSKLDIDKTGIKLLDQDSFYFPNDHYDYVKCFCNDFGVQQIVSQYYYLFAQKEFVQLSKNCSLLTDKLDLYSNCNLMIGNNQSILHNDIDRFQNYHKTIDNIRVALCGAYYTADVITELKAKSKGRIGEVSPPFVSLSPKKIDKRAREKLITIPCESPFDRFFVQTIFYCLPKILLEYFHDYLSVYSKDIEERNYTHLVSEVWRSFSPTSIYLAVAQYHGKKLIFQQHGASTQWRSVHIEWIEHLVSDAFITTGWKTTEKSNLIQGGWSVREINPYVFDKSKTRILYISSTSPKYLYEMSGIKFNSRFTRYLKNINEFARLLPERLKGKFLIRLRKDPYLWDTKHTLDLPRNETQSDEGVSHESFTQLLSNSKIVIIDHFTTGIAEILYNNVPCIIIHDPSIDYLDKHSTSGWYEDLIRCGIVHNTPQSAVTHLESIYHNVEEWWSRDCLQKVIKKIVHDNLRDPSYTINYLLSCLDESL